MKLSNPLLSLRTITSNDNESLCNIYSSTRTEELALITSWTSKEKEAFLRSQFNAQHTYYQNNYRNANFWVIEYGFQIIGRLYLQTYYDANSIRIIDIALLPEWRNKGIGKQILLDIMKLAEDLHRSITIHVESFNRAMTLYKKLGFVSVSQTNGVYHLLEWKGQTPGLAENKSIKQSVTNGSRTTTFNSI